MLPKRGIRVDRIDWATFNIRKVQRKGLVKQP